MRGASRVGWRLEAGVTADCLSDAGSTDAPGQLGDRLRPLADGDRKPILVDPIVASFCRAPSQTGLRAREAERKRHGPHYKPSIVVRTNSEAIGAFKAGDAPMPVGTTIVKEKHYDLLAKGPPAEYGAMIKREPGYDSGHGDWEYLYVVSQPDKTLTRGKLKSCIDCHSHAKDKDYLFRTFLPGQTALVPGW